MSLKIKKAIYFDPSKSSKSGTNVTKELSAQVKNGQLFYQGTYNSIFPDQFKGIRKRLEIEIEYKGKIYPKFYNEDDKMDLPHDLGGTEKWWNRTGIQILFVLGALASIIGVYALFR